MSKKVKLITATLVLIMFLASVSLAYIWFGWEMAVVIALGVMSATGSQFKRITYDPQTR